MLVETANRIAHLNEKKKENSLDEDSFFPSAISEHHLSWAASSSTYYRSPAHSLADTWPLIYANPKTSPTTTCFLKMAYIRLPTDDYVDDESLIQKEVQAVFQKPKKKPMWKALLCLIGYLVFVSLTATLYWFLSEKDEKQNVIFMVTDGMGPASLSLARSFKQYRDNLGIDDVLALDTLLIGSSRTRSNDSLVTDSAAGATAFSCALKTYNGAIGVDSDKNPCGTILEALKLNGWLTGLVVTTRITDATPAAFSAHADYRFQEDLIAQHQLGEYPLGRMVDLMIGGGRCHFLPRSESGGCRNDNRNLILEAQDKGWSYAGDREAFDELQEGKNVTLPLLSLLAPTDIPYDLDRDPKEHPSLAEQVRVALTALSKATRKSKKGFFLLIEGSRIDHAGHHNDPAAQVREVLAYDEAMKEVMKFVNNTSTKTTVISTSDHETGGLSTARQITESYPDYLWYPEVLLNSSHSGEYLVKKVMSKLAELSHDRTLLQSFIAKEIIEKDMGIKDYTEEEVSAVEELSKNANKLLGFLNNMISVRSQTGWSTSGHSAVDVNIYAFSNSEKITQKLLQKEPYTGLLGNHENIEIGAFMSEITGADLARVTKLIRDTKHSPKSVHELEASSDDLHMHAVQKAH